MTTNDRGKGKRAGLTQPGIAALRRTAELPKIPDPRFSGSIKADSHGFGDGVTMSHIVDVIRFGLSIRCFCLFSAPLWYGYVQKWFISVVHSCQPWKTIKESLAGCHLCNCCGCCPGDCSSLNTKDTCSHIHNEGKKYLQVGLPDTVRGLNLFRPVIPPKSRGVAQCMDLNKLFLKLSIF